MTDQERDTRETGPDGSTENRRTTADQDERLERFASLVSHDLRNPLNVAMGRLQLVAEECDSEHVEPIENSLERMEALIADSLALARGGRRVTDPEPTSLRDVATSAWATVDADAATLAVDDDPGVVQADGDRLRQAFEQLFENAVDHGGPDVTVRVGRRDDGDGFYVADDGPGIDEDVRDDVFDDGFSTDTDGTGFGLPIVEAIAGAHGWRVELATESAGGARFDVRDVDVE